MRDVWQACHGDQYLTPLKATAFRMTVTGEREAVRDLAGSLEEQKILEEMLDSVRPYSISHSGLHPLLSEPFRKHWGSRFAEKTANSLWYGAGSSATAMAEVAFHRLCRLRASVVDYGLVKDTYLLFSAQVSTARGIRLSAAPFLQYRSEISSPVSYVTARKLGISMRAADVEAFDFFSARDCNGGVNFALFTPAAFTRKTPVANSLQLWKCFASTEKVEFVRMGTLEPESKHFTADSFQISGELPMPVAD